jgi:hypothetical protein
MSTPEQQFEDIVRASLSSDGMMRFSLPDGKMISGRTYTDIVQSMSDEKFVPPASLSSYRRATAKRIEAMYHTAVPVDNDKMFVRAMIDAELLIPVVQ